MKVGVTQRVEKIQSYEEIRDSLDHRLVHWITDLGFVPVPIPNNLVNISESHESQPRLEDWLSSVGIDFILLSGGNDIGFCGKRDLTESFLLFWANKMNKPLLGICRGMQMMGVFAGSKLEKLEGHVNVYHRIKSRIINEILPEKVNSYHNFALNECPNEYSILGTAEDGSIEAIKHSSNNWEGWMWHPEREKPYHTIDQERFISMVKMQNNNPKVILLLAGEGKRLRPYTIEKPKCMVEINGKSLIDSQIKILRSADLDNFILIGGYKAEMLKYIDCPLIINSRYASTNMVWSLFCAEDEMDQEVIVSYGDIIYSKSVLMKLINSSADIAVVIDKDWESYWKARNENPLDDAETLRLRDDGTISEIEENLSLLKRFRVNI